MAEMILENKNILDELIEDYPALASCRADIEKAYFILEECYKNGGKLLACGNGGSASDSTHIVGELMKGFKLKRPLSDEAKKAFSELPGGEYIASGLQGALPAISLTTENALMTAFLNDCDPDLVFAQQVYGLMKKGDVLIALSTSGNSKNVVHAAVTAKALCGKSVAITGERESKLSELCDCTIKLPSRDTAKIQEYTLPVYHALCAMLEAAFFDC